MAEKSEFTIETVPNSERDTVSCKWTIEDKRGNPDKGWLPMERTQLSATFNVAGLSRAMVLRLLAIALKLWCRMDIMRRRAAGEDITHHLVYMLTDEDFVTERATGPKDPAKTATNAIGKIDDEAALQKLMEHAQAQLAKLQAARA